MVAGLETPLHEGPPQVVHPVPQAQRLVHRGVVLNGEGRGGGGVQDAQVGSDQFHLSGGQFRVDGLAVASFQAPGGDHDELGPQAPRLIVRRGCGVRLEHHLRQSAAIPQIDEYHAPMIPPPVYPTAQGDLLPDMLRAQ